MTDKEDIPTKADADDMKESGKNDTAINPTDELTDEKEEDSLEVKVDEEKDAKDETIEHDKDKRKEKKEKTDETKKEEAEDEDFHYIVRIANTDLDGHKQVIYALTQIKGIGRRMAIFIADATGVDRYIKIGKLSDEQIEKLKSTIDNISTVAPSWMLNHRLEYDTGQNVHYISNDVTARLRDDINFMKMIRCYKGIRHELGLPVRGQRTRSNGRKGLALGVSRKAAGGQKPSSSQSSSDKSKDKSKQSKKKE